MPSETNESCNCLSNKKARKIIVQYIYGCNCHYAVEVDGFQLSQSLLLYFTLFYLQAQSPGQPPPPLLKRCAAVLDPLTKSVPGLLEGLYLMAKVKYLSGTKMIEKSAFSSI